MLRIGHIKNRRPVQLVLAVQPVDRAARMMSHVSDVTVALAHDERLVGRPSIQTVGAEQLGVPFGLRRSDVVTTRRQNRAFEFRRWRYRMPTGAMIEMRCGKIRTVWRIVLGNSVRPGQEHDSANCNCSNRLDWPRFKRIA